jgi:hypothetical protein
LMGMGFWVGYVKRRVGYLAVPKGLVERDVVDDLTSSCVYENACALHFLEFFLADEIVGFW